MRVHWLSCQSFYSVDSIGINCNDSYLSPIYMLLHYTSRLVPTDIVPSMTVPRGSSYYITTILLYYYTINYEYFYS